MDTWPCLLQILSGVLLLLLLLLLLLRLLHQLQLGLDHVDYLHRIHVLIQKLQDVNTFQQEQEQSLDEQLVHGLLEHVAETPGQRQAKRHSARVSESLKHAEVPRPW